MSDGERSIILGTVLGDGYLHKSKFNTTSLHIKQADRYKEYVFWLYENLNRIFKSQPRQRKDNLQWYVRSSYSQELNTIHDLFYVSGTKIIPRNIDQILTSPLSLAVWFMDDGTLDYRPKDHCAFHLSTNCFSRKDTEHLIRVLKNNFGIEATLHYTLCRGKKHSRIYIGSRGRDRFIELVEPYILNCFQYKLPRYRTPQRLAQILSERTGQILGDETIMVDGLI